jgi:hypothetical protein
MHGKQQEERLQALIDSSPLALVEFGLDTRIRLWNPAAEHQRSHCHAPSPHGHRTRPPHGAAHGLTV